MKRKHLLFLAALLSAAPLLTAHATTATTVPTDDALACPAAASAAGFGNLVFDDEFTTSTTISSSTSVTTGYNWYPYFWEPATASMIKVSTGTQTGTLAGATGVVTLSGGNIATCYTYPTKGGQLAGSYQHGYFEARLQFNTSTSSSGQALWPAFWSYGTNAYIPGNGGTWPLTMVAELDFLEAYPLGGTGPSSIDGINTLHTWEYPANSTSSTDVGNTNGTNLMMSLQGSTESAQPNDGKWHIFGCLWVSTGSNTGYVQFYYDNYLVVHQNGITRFATGSGTSLTAQESNFMTLIVGSSAQQPVNVDWVHVWQGGTSSTTTTTSSSTSGTGTATQTVSSFPSTLSLTTAQSPYVFPATSSAGLPLVYSVASGPGTLSSNTLTLSGTGTIIVNASQAGTSTYSSWSSVETITVSAATGTGAQTLSGFPSTLDLTTAQTPYTLPSVTSGGLTVTYTVASGPATVSGDTLKLTGAGTVVLNARQAGSSTYAAFSATETVTVTAVPQTVPSLASAVTLNTTETPYMLPATTAQGLTLTYTVSSGPATVSGDTLYLTGAAGTVVLKATQAGNATYAAYSGTETITVASLATQTVSDFPATLVLTGTQTPYTLPAKTSAGLTISYDVVSGPATVSGNILTLTSAGTIVLTGKQAGSSSYAAWSASEAITCAVGTQTIPGFPVTLSLSTGQSPYTLPATTSEGLPITYSMISGPATVSGNTLTLTGAGAVGVRAVQAGNAFYSAYSSYETITVTALAVQTVSNFPATQSVTLRSTGYTLTSTTSAGQAITYTVVSGPATISGDTLTVTGTGTVVVSASAAGTSSYAGYSGSETFTVTAGSTLTFTQWESQPGFFTAAQVANTAISGPTATPENDGVPNLLKYVYDINPAQAMTQASYAAMPQTDIDTTTTPGTTYLTLTYRQYAKLTGVTIQVQTSPDLQNWTTVTPSITTQVGTDATTGDPIMEDEVNTNGQSSEFIRLNVTSP